jgi:folate-binding protein YgfZ
MPSRTATSTPFTSLAPDPARELQVEAARASVLAIPSPGLGAVDVTGGDRVAWLNGLVTCDLAGWGADGAAASDARYGLLVGRNGRVLADPILVAGADRVLCVVPIDVVTRLGEHLDHYLVMEDAEVAPAPHAFAIWCLHGPASGAVLAAARDAGATGGAIDRTGLGGAIVLAPADRAAEIRGVLEGAVIEARGSMGDEAGWEALRLERGVPRFGVDFDEKTYPQEASLEKTAVSFKKGCYLGQEVVCMLEMRGHVKRKLVSIVLDGAETPPAEPSGAAVPVADEAGAAVGEVTSLALSPTLGVPVGLAMLKRAQAVAGARVRVGASGIHATVVERPA